MDYYDELSTVERRAIYDYELKPEQLAGAKDLGDHTFDAMDILKERYPSESYENLFSRVKELNAIQVKGLSCKLTETQVQSNNFGVHILIAMEVLKKKDPFKGYEEIFPSVEGYNEEQAIGFSQYDLTDDQVNSLNYTSVRKFF